MSKSILQDEKRCYLCGGDGFYDRLDRHHIFNGALRDKSERFGLWVWLCHEQCHIFGRNAAHVSGATRRQLQSDAQKKAMETYGWSMAEWRKEFYKNNLQED